MVAPSATSTVLPSIVRVTATSLTADPPVRLDDPLSLVVVVGDKLTIQA